VRDGARRACLSAVGVEDLLSVRGLHLAYLVPADCRQHPGPDESLVALPHARPWLALDREMIEPPLGKLADADLGRDRVVADVEAPERGTQLLLGLRFRLEP
jgi:hypothetical protein